MSDQRPRLILIAGPNGTGKTEFTTEAFTQEWLQGCEYINPDQIAQNEFGDWNSPSAVESAAKLATDLRYKCLSIGRSLALETVFSSEEKVEFVKKVIQSNFFVRMFFIGTDNPMINASRIAQRVMEGGHDVPIRKIIDRYRKSIMNLTKVLPLVDRGYVYDNSVDHATPELQFRTVDGSTEKIYSNKHAWSNDVREQTASHQNVEDFSKSKTPP